MPALYEEGVFCKRARLWRLGVRPGHGNGRYAIAVSIRGVELVAVCDVYDGRLTRAGGFGVRPGCVANQRTRIATIGFGGMGMGDTQYAVSIRKSSLWPSAISMMAG